MAVNLTPEQVAQLHTLTAQNLGDISKSITDTIKGSVNRLVQEQREGQQRSTNQGKIKEQCENITKCDGLVTEEIREWLKSVDLAVRNTNTIDNNVRRITRKTTGGQLYRSIEAKFQANAATTWMQLKTYVSDAFLGTNEGERLRLELSKVRQGPDSVLMFNRKFREMADTAYGVAPRQAEIEAVNTHNKFQEKTCLVLSLISADISIAYSLV